MTLEDAVQVFISHGLFAELVKYRNSGVRIGTQESYVDSKFRLITGRILTILLIDFDNNVWGIHDNDSIYYIYKSSDFDEAVNFVLDFFQNSDL